MWICYYTDITNQLTTRLTLISIASARKAILNVNILLLHPVWHQPDKAIISAVNDVYEVANLPRNTHYDYRRCLANSEIEGDCLFLDTDTIIQKDVSHIFERDFDVAPTKRISREIFNPQIPYNMGVVFARCPLFWKHVANTMPRFSKRFQDIEGAFSKICMIKSEYRIQELPGNLYNHTPAKQGEISPAAAIVHYKGPQRKNWMLMREKEFLG